MLSKNHLYTNTFKINISPQSSLPIDQRDMSSKGCDVSSFSARMVLVIRSKQTNESEGV